jgi:paraquat-inducible protein B
MSKRANPTLIGAFVLGALALGVFGVAVLASDSLFQQETTFVSYFDESVNGLDIGAPVKFKGVPIGQVSDILVRMDLDAETFQVPVLYDVDLRPLTDEVGRTVDLSDPEVHRRQVEDGLRAQLQMESFVTGKLYVEITFVPKPERVTLPERKLPYLEIPTVLSPMAKLGEEATGLVSSLRGFDVNTINENLITLLAKANQKIDELNVRAINDSVLVAVQSVRRLTDAPEIRATLAELPGLARRVDSTLADASATLQSLNDAMGPAGQDVKTTAEDLRQTLAEVRTTLARTRQMMSTDSGLGYRVDDALTSLTEAAEALRVLAVSLERDPSMFIRGKEPPEED